MNEQVAQLLVRNTDGTLHALAVLQKATSGRGNGLHVDSANASVPAAVIKGAGALLDLQDADGVSRFRVDSGGVLALSGIEVGLDAWAPADHGMDAWAYDPVLVSTQTVSVAGTLYAQRLKRRSATSVTNVILHVGTAGSSLTAGQCFAALYTGAGVLVAVTADQSGSWNSTGVKTMALVGGPYALAAGDYYVAYFSNGTTPPSFGRVSTTGGSGGANTGLTAPNLRACSADTGLTTAMPSTMGAQTVSAIVGWAAIA